MIPKVPVGARTVVIIVVAVISNAFLFVSISFVQNLFGLGNHKKIIGQSRLVMAEYVRPQTQEKKQTQSAFRSSMGHASSLSGFGSAGAEGPPLRFSPDLSVEGGNGAGIGMGGQDLSALIFEEGKTDEGIVPLSMDPIPYPEEARELGVMGVVEVVLVIGREGQVSSIEIVRSPHSSITAAARRVIAGWRFKPAKNKGVPVNVRVRKLIEFKLD